jgi:hypothetical protein
MPRTPIDYSKTIIYHFICNDKLIADSYVGHTTDMRRRKANHKSICNNEKDQAYNFKLYQNIRANGNWENWQMIPLEEFSCQNKIQACIREQYWIDTLQAKLNNEKAYSGFENRDEYKKNYDELHKEDYNRRAIEWREKNDYTVKCECGLDVKRNYLSTHIKLKKHINSMANV